MLLSTASFMASVVMYADVVIKMLLTLLTATSKLLSSLFTKKQFPLLRRYAP